MLQLSWKRWWTEIGAQGDGAALMQRLLAAYEEPQRRYHTLEHLTECLDLVARYRHVAVEPAEVLAEFIARKSIYNTAPLRNALEHQARENLAYSLQPLHGRG